MLNDFGLEHFLLRPDYSLKMTNAEKIRHSRRKRPKDSKNGSKESLDYTPGQNNGIPSKNPDIKTPLVVSFSLGVVIHILPLAAF